MWRYDFDGKFIYVDFWRPNFNWIRIKISEIPNLREKYPDEELFVTIQQFQDARSKEDELIYSPLYIDLDGDWKEVCKDAKLLIDFFNVALELKPPAYQIYFSGSKGLHIIVHPFVFGIEPRPDLHRVMDFIVKYLTRYLKLKTVDFNVYSKRRMWRLEGSLHGKSKLYKIEISEEDLNLPLKDLKALAKQPRELFPDDVNLLLEEDYPIAKEFYKTQLQDYEELTYLSQLKPSERIQETSEYPVCIQDLLENHIRKEDTRNKATLCLACYFKDIGYSYNKAEKIIVDWIKRIPRELTSIKDEKELIQRTVSVIKTVYNQEDYHFICGVARSLGLTCPGTCEAVGKKQALTPIEVKFQDAFSAKYIGLPLKIHCLPVGCSDATYAYPTRVKYACMFQKDTKICERCPLFGRGEEIIDLTPEDILSVIHCSTSSKTAYLQNLMKVPRCNSLVIEEIEKGNLIELEVINPSKSSFELFESNGASTIKKVYLTSSGIGLSEETIFTGYAVPHPRTQEIVFFAIKKEAVSTQISAFSITEEDKQDLKIFQPKDWTPEEIKKKLNEIYSDLEKNVLHIWKRRDIIFAVDLIYHTPLYFPYGNEIIKGWAELFILGDTGCGKTTICERLIKFYGLGEKISGESAKRTGLAWTWTKHGDNWFVRFGIIPINDRKLVVIDEFSGISDEEFRKLTDLRSSGIADATGGPVQARSYARTRLIFISNPKYGNAVSEFVFPLEALRQLIPRREDLRRLDLVVVAKQDDVPSDVLLALPPEGAYHQYTHDLCHKLILWAWSRKPENIIIPKAAWARILEHSKEISQQFSEKIPLAMPADFKFKLTRLALGLACRLFSTMDGENVYLHPAIIDFVVEFIKDCYIKLGYDEYSMIYKDYNMLKSEAELIYEEMRRIKNYPFLVELLLIQGELQKSSARELLHWDDDEWQANLHFLVVNRILDMKKKKNSYHLTEQGIALLKVIRQKIEEEFGSIKDALKYEMGYGYDEEKEEESFSRKEVKFNGFFTD